MKYSLLNVFLCGLMILCATNAFAQLVPYKANDKWGFKDKAGTIFIEGKYEQVGSFHEGLAPVQEKKKWGYINLKGQLEIPIRFTFASHFSEGLAGVYLDGKWGYINKKGEFVIQPKFNEDISLFKEEVAAVKHKEKWGFINKKGEFVIQPKFEEASPFSESLAAVKYENGWGFINKKGEFVIQPKFQNVMSFIDSKAAVKYNREWKCINKKGQFINPPGNTQFYFKGKLIEFSPKVTGIPEDVKFDEFEIESENHISKKDKKLFGFVFVKVDKKVMIVQVFKKTPAFRKGLTSGDIILKVNGNDITEKTLMQLKDLFSKIDSCEMQILRDGETKKVKLAKELIK